MTSDGHIILALIPMTMLRREKIPAPKLPNAGDKLERRYSEEGKCWKSAGKRG